MSPAFTIVLPVRNGGDYLKLAIGSILAQTATDWRLLVLENGSTDETPAYLSTLDDPRISIHAATSPLSIVENWGRIKDLPVTGYTTVLGHDDILHPDFIERALSDIAAHPDASLWMSHFTIIDGSGGVLRKCAPMPEKERGSGLLQARWTQNRDSFGTGYVFRFEDYRAAGGIPPFPGLLYADDYIWARLAQKSWLYCSPREGFQYRSHSASAARTSDAGTAIAGAACFFGKLVEDASRDPDLSRFLREYGRRFTEHIELCHWQAQARSVHSGPLKIVPLPTEWPMLREKFPVNPKSLKFFVLRQFWQRKARVAAGQ